MRIALAVYLSIAVVGLLGCAPSMKIVSPWDAERNLAAAQALEADPSLKEDEQALIEAGLAHAFPHSPVYDPDVAIQRFTDLIELYPQSQYRNLADQLVPLLESVTTLQSDLQAQHQRVDEVLDRLIDHDARVRQMEHEITRAEDQVDIYRGLVRALRREIELREERIVQLEETLEGLMQIDLTTSD